MSKYKLALFDMDGTLIKEKGIFVIAKRLGFYDDLVRIFNDDKIDFYEKSIEIAKLSKGFREDEYIAIFRTIPYNDNAEKVIRELKRRDIKTAIVTDSYKLLADDLKNRLGIDYAFGNNLIARDGVFTGEIEIHNKELRREEVSGRTYSICKSHVLEELCGELNVSLDDSIAVGDGRIDMGMIKKAGLGIAYKAPEEVKKVADVAIDDLALILHYI